MNVKLRGLGFGRNLRRTGRAQLLGWLVWPAVILATPVFLILAVILVTFLLIVSAPTSFRLWRAYRRLKKARKEEANIIEGEYWVRDDDYKRW